MFLFRGSSKKLIQVSFNHLLKIRSLKLCSNSAMGSTNKTPTIGTHNGVFHCDDALACYMLTRLPQYKHANIVRTRDQAVLDNCDVVVDVGSVYDHNTKRYDHHQKQFDHCLHSLEPEKDFHIKLSSAGLVYHHYGRQIIQNILDLKDNDNEQIESVFDKVYENFLQEIDGIDNGIEMFDGPPKYRINTNLSTRVSFLTPVWNEKTSEEILYQRFLEAIKLTGKEFEERVVYYGKVWYLAKVLVKQAVEEREKIHQSGTIIELQGGLPWRDHLFQLERFFNIEGEIKYVIFQDVSDNWRVLCTPIEPKSFILRCPLLAEWRGLRDEELAEKSGIPGAIFVHSTGFIGGCSTREGVIEMAIKTLQQSRSKNGDSVI